MNHVIPDKFPETGINQLAADAGLYTPDEWPEAVPFVGDNIRQSREAAMEDIVQIELSERQIFAMNNLAIPAIVDTLSDVFGTEAQSDILGTTFVSLLASEDFKTYFGPSEMRIAGAYFSDRNQIAVNQGNHASDSPEDLAYFTKVFIHEFFHYLSHQFSHLDRTNAQLAIHRVGMRALGKDIREASKGELTWDYFTAMSEAVTEKLAIETYQKIAQDTVFKNPDGTLAVPFESYPKYRRLLDKVTDDAIRYQATNLSKTDLWHSVCRANLTGELKPLLQLVRATYPGLSMKEFGLMTNVDDLPQDSDFEWNPSGEGRYSRTLSESYLTRLRDRLNGKTSADYITDVPPPPPPPPSPSAAVVVFANEIRTHRENKMLVTGITATTPDGRFIDMAGAIVNHDEYGLDIHYDEAWLSEMLELLIDVGMQFRHGTISAEQAGEVIDQTLFDTRHISELSSGFDEFYVAKHLLLDPGTSSEDFDTAIKDSQKKLAALRRHR